MTRILHERTTDDAFWTAPAVTDEQAERETHVPNRTRTKRVRRCKQKMQRQAQGRAAVLEERALPKGKRRLTEAEKAAAKQKQPTNHHAIRNHK